MKIPLETIWLMILLCTICRLSSWLSYWD